MTKIGDLTDWFGGKETALVALSGGVDSALVAYAAFESLGDGAVAVTADYRTLAREELDSARRVCSEIGIRQVLLDYDELGNEDFARNDPGRCFHCRTELGERLRGLARGRGADVVVDGTNLDDLGDYRPGIEAMRQNGIRSPLVEAGFAKKDVREAARLAGLSVYDRPSNSCLASRIPWGQRVTSERLARIELGETVVKQATRLRQVRVRDVGGAASIEVESRHLDRLGDARVMAGITARLKLMGFSSVSVDPRGYSPGRANVTPR